MSASWYVGVDIGGTFTDVVAVDAESGALHHLKVPSSRSDPAAGFVAGLAALRDEVGVQQSDLRLCCTARRLRPTRSSSVDSRRPRS